MSYIKDYNSFNGKAPRDNLIESLDLIEKHSICWHSFNIKSKVKIQNHKSKVKNILIQKPKAA